MKVSDNGTGTKLLMWSMMTYKILEVKKIRKEMSKFRQFSSLNH